MSQSQTYAPSNLRIEPHMLPRLREAFERAALLLRLHLDPMGHLAYLPGQWLGDADSGELYDHYQSWVMGGDGGPFAAANAYARQLEAVARQLRDAEDAYRQAEGDNADLWGRA